MDRGIRLFWVLVCILCGAACFFAVGAEERRRQIQEQLTGAPGVDDTTTETPYR